MIPIDRDGPVRLRLIQDACSTIEREMLSGLLKMSACDKLTVADIKMIAENARRIAFDAINETAPA